MKFKYFLRGLGTGIIFTTIICLVAFQGADNKTITDKEVIEKAKTLGMVEKEESVKDMLAQKKDTSSEVSETPKETSTTEAVSEENPTREETTEEKLEKKDTKKTSTEKKTTEEKTTEEKTTEKKTTEQSANQKGEMVTITIKGGSTSFPICQELQKLGMIQDATDFDNYLIKNGYANRISVGTHTLTIGMSYKEIAVAISDPQ